MNDLLAAHDALYRDMAGICSEMIGAGRYLADHPEYGTDEVVANVFREYLAKMEARRAEWLASVATSERIGA